MFIRIDVISSHRERRQALTLLRHGDLAPLIGHGERRTCPVRFDLLRLRTRGAPLCQIHEYPDRIRTGKTAAAAVVHVEITVAVQTFELCRKRPHRDLFPQLRIPLHDDLPVGQDPRLLLLSEIFHPQPNRL